jgi:hypothetical protein
MELILFGFDIGYILVNIGIALAIAMPLGKLHEYIHKWTAERLGYKVTGFKLWKNETDVDIKKSDPNWKKVAYAPYYYLIPLGLCIMTIGFIIIDRYIGLGLVVGGGGTVLMHVVSIRMEGRDEQLSGS